MLKIYDSKDKKKKEFIPLNQNEVTLYVCGPTLYGDIHIGNARPIIFFDVVYKYLKMLGLNVKYVSNITDIDDKIINKAISQNISEEELVDKNKEEYEKVLSKLNVQEVFRRPTVTEYMPKIIEFIEELLRLDYAYKTEDGDVYFRVHKIDDYGSISNRKIEELIVGDRIDVVGIKERDEDFALWKNTSTGIVWDTSFGTGRPGWHTECTVMIEQIFGGRIDIHGGGMDLKFPHHENENAQFRATHNQDIANYWMHNGFVNIDGEKMSKSLGNFILVKDLLENYCANVVRLLLLQTNYRQPINLSQEFIKQTQKLLRKIEEFSLNIYEDEITSYFGGELDIRIKEVMDDDFNTPNLISLLLESIKEKDAKLYLQIIYILGLDLKFCIKVDNLSLDLQDLILQFEDYKTKKDFEKLDEIKEKIQQAGYQIYVTRQGIRIKEEK